MKKFVSIAVSALLLFFVPSSVFAAPGDVAGTVYGTDIVTYMYYAPVTSYNIGGKTCIDAEILNWHYGFDVYWHETERRLDINDKGGRFVSLQAMSGEITEGSDSAPGAPVGKYYETDIVTTLNGSKIESYNIGGRTVICAEAMRDFGYNVDWSEQERTLTISKPMDFYKYDTDFGTIKSMDNYMLVREKNTFFNRGVIITKDDKQYLLNTPSNRLYADPMGICYMKLGDFASILGGECTMSEKTVTAVSDWANGITDEYDEYSYVFALNYDDSASPELSEYIEEESKMDSAAGSGYILDIPVNKLLINGSEYEIKSMYGGKEFDCGLIAVEGEIYIPVYSLTRLLGCDYAY